MSSVLKKADKFNLSLLSNSQTDGNTLYNLWKVKNSKLGAKNYKPWLEPTMTVRRRIYTSLVDFFVLFYVSVLILCMCVSLYVSEYFDRNEIGIFMKLLFVAFIKLAK